MLRRARPIVLLGATLLASAVSVLAETLEIPGLSAPATVYTDALGVPHILAETLEDAARVEGYVHARDRFFQMDVSRRRAEGTLAELTGRAIDRVSDSVFRPWGLRTAAERSVELLGDEERAIAQAYADGVNAWLATHALPGEYAGLELTRARPWSVTDSQLVGKFFGWFFDVNSKTYEPTYTGYLERYVAAGEASLPPFDGRALADEDVSRTAPLDPAATVPDAGGGVGPPVPSASQRARASRRPSARLPRAAVELARRHGEALEAAPEVARPRPRGAEGPGSNEWGIAGSASATGTPLVATDAHTLLSVPSVGYELHLLVRSDPEVQLIRLSGVSIPGLPFVLVGQSERLAWGMTDAPFDQLDYFADRLLRDAPACPARFCIESAGALHPVEVTGETFRTNLTDNGLPDDAEASAPTPQLRVPFRGFGPVSEIAAPGFVEGEGEAETTVLTAQSTLLHGSREFRALLAFARAQDVFEFRDAVRDFDAISLNFVVADVVGNLAYFTSGEVPLRADLEAGTPLDRPELVREGSGAGNWVSDPARADGQSIPFGVVPFDEMPQLVNPPNGFLVNANNDPLGILADNDSLNSFRPSSPGAIYYLTALFDFGGRAGRLTQLVRAKLDAAQPLTVADMKAFQGDTRLRQAELVVPFLLAAWEAAQQPGAPTELAAFALDPEVAEAAGRLDAWDFSTPTGIPEGYDASDADGVRSADVPPPEVEASVAATLYHAFRLPLIENTLGVAIDATGADLPFVADEGFHIAALHHHLSQQPFTGIGGSGLDLFPGLLSLSAAERRDVALLQSLRDALDRLASDEFADAFGHSTNQDEYRWGKLHRVTLDHHLDGERSIPPAAGFVDLSPALAGLARDGARGTVNVGGDLRGFENGSNWRLVMAPGHPDAAPDAVLGFASFPGGSSGDFESPLYASQLPAWLTVDYHEVPVSEADVAIFPGEDVELLPVSKQQRSCAQTANQAGARVGKTQGKEDTACLVAAAKGGEADPQACVSADPRRRIARSRDKAATNESKKCVAGGIPAFGYAGAASASDAGAAASLGLVEDFFGSNLNSAVIPKATDKAGAACQSELLETAQAALGAIWKETAKAKKSALAGKKGVAPAGSGIELQDALLPVFAPSAKVEKALAKVAQAALKKCGSVADLAVAFPGRCQVTGATAHTAALGTCARERVLCRGCRSVGAMEALALPCDGLDDGVVDDSCG